MATQIFVNLPVKNLDRSIEFFTQLGFSFNAQFTDDSSTCMIIGENIFAMLLVEERFRNFTKKEICNAKKSTEVLIAIDAESREHVDDMVRKAIEAGGALYSEPQDHGWMYQHAFEDPDGHQWEICYMDASAIPSE